jgi:tetratricopeptide (TPR) repeat protein
MASDEAAAVRHLVELGYEDPQDAARARLVAQRALDADLANARQALDAGRTVDAIELLEALAGAAPGWAPPRRLLAFACYGAGQMTSALAHLDWLELHAVEHAQLALLRATIELARRRFDAALDQAAYARHLDESLPGPDAVRGEVHLRRGDLDAAESAFQRAAELAPGDAGPWSGLAAIALRRGNYDAAIDAALHALELNLELPSAHYRLGIALADIQKYPESRVALETFARLSPDRAAPFRLLATICEEMEDGVSAAEYRQRGRQLITQRRNDRQMRSS